MNEIKIDRDNNGDFVAGDKMINHFYTQSEFNINSLSERQKNIISFIFNSREKGPICIGMMEDGSGELISSTNNRIEFQKFELQTLEDLNLIKEVDGKIHLMSQGEEIYKKLNVKFVLVDGFNVKIETKNNECIVEKNILFCPECYCVLSEINGGFKCKKCKWEKTAPCGREWEDEWLIETKLNCSNKAFHYNLKECNYILYKALDNKDRRIILREILKEDGLNVCQGINEKLNLNGDFFQEIKNLQDVELVTGEYDHEYRIPFPMQELVKVILSCYKEE